MGRRQIRPDVGLVRLSVFKILPMTQREDCRQVAEWLEGADGAVAFTGAGISTESGIPDFRSPGGVWSKYRPVMYEDFLARAEARHEYWRQKCEAHHDFAAAEPNAGHRVLARWEQAGLLWGLAIGSSLVVEPAASLPRLARAAGARLVIVNRDPTGQDEIADLVLRESIGKTLTGIDEIVRGG